MATFQRLASPLMKEEVIETLGKLRRQQQYGRGSADRRELA